MKHGHCKSGSSSCTLCERAIFGLAEELADAKIGFVRCWFPWRFFEPRLRSEEEIASDDGSGIDYPMDSFVNILTDHGVNVIPVVACGYQRMLPNGLEIDSDRDGYVKHASLHAKLLVRRYRRKIRFWQIENEPNWWAMHVVGGWRKGFAWLDFHTFRIQLLKALNDAVHSEDPRAQTIISLEADWKINASSYTPLCDLIGLDFYPNYKFSSPIDTSIFTKAKEVAKTTGKPVIISETGYPSGPRLLGYSAARQCEYISKACSQAFETEALNAIGLWRYSDTAWRSFPFQENHFGLTDAFGNPKPAWTTLAQIARKLA